MKVKIVAIGKKDAFRKHGWADRLIGVTGEFTPRDTTKKGWQSGSFRTDQPLVIDGENVHNHLYFARVKVEPVEQEIDSLPTDIPIFLDTWNRNVDKAEPERVTITGVAPYDEFYSNKEKLIGVSGWIKRTPSRWDKRFFAASFVSDVSLDIDNISSDPDNHTHLIFAGVQVKPEKGK